MKTLPDEMVNAYQTDTMDEKKNAIGRSHAGNGIGGRIKQSRFFKAAAFYGGTALRIFYDLDRFSEDMDFSLMIPDSAVSYDKIFSNIRKRN